MTSYVRASRAPDTTFRCGFRGCTSFASHVLIAGHEELCRCCAQCAAVGVRAHRESADGKVFAVAGERLLVTGFQSAPSGVSTLLWMRKA